MPAPSEERADIQGLVHSGYGSLTEACFLLLRITDRAAARAWLGVAPVTTAADRDVTKVLQIALSVDGMRALGAAEPVIGGFSAEFLSGLAGEEGRSRRLGDVAANAPSAWRWGARYVPDLLVILCAAPGMLASWRAQVIDEQFRRGFEIVEDLATTDMRGKEPFGFADGVSQPELDWQEARTPGTTADLDYGNLISPGEFMLGYRNEYGLYSDRPLLEPTAAGAGDLPPAEDDPSRRDLGRNGSYLVFRELHQDVRGFWRFAAAQAGNPIAATRFAEKLVGRTLSGTPLVPGTRAIAGIGTEAADIAQNGFTFDPDADGLRCPFGAHIRRANPRTGDMPGGRQGLISRLNRMLGFFRSDLRDDLIAASRFHRILRRGREFGRYLPAADAVQPDAPDPQCGLNFICLNANLSRQFEFIQNAWLMSAKFDGMSGETDPLLGNREPHPPDQATDGFSLPQPNGVMRRVSGVPQFITVAGGGYFFLPGIRALRYFASAPP
jgi:deferrochelatase/peroxidase EfeB